MSYHTASAMIYHITKSFLKIFAQNLTTTSSSNQKIKYFEYTLMYEILCNPCKCSLKLYIRPFFYYSTII